MTAETGPISDLAPRIEPIRGNLEEVLLAGNQGTCRGVETALEAVRQVMELVPIGQKVYTTNSPVNFPGAFEQYGDRLKSINGDISLVEDEEVLIGAAHGFTQKLRKEAKKRKIHLIDATCSIVLDEHQKVRTAADNGQHTVFIGEEDHPETIGVRGQVEEDQITVIDPDKGIGDVIIPDGSLVIAKTTYAPSYTAKTVSQIQEINDTVDATRAHSCYAVKNRILSGEQMMDSIDFWLVVGDITSHNSRELKNIGPRRDTPAALITGPEQIDWNWFNDQVRRLGVSSGASVPKMFTDRVLQPFIELGIPITELPQAVEEKKGRFRLPIEDIDALKARFPEN